MINSFDKINLLKNNVANNNINTMPIPHNTTSLYKQEGNNMPSYQNPFLQKRDAFLQNRFNNYQVDTKADNPIDNSIQNRLSGLQQNLGIQNNYKVNKLNNLIKEGNLNKAIDSTANFKANLFTGNIQGSADKVAMVQQGLKSQGVKYSWGGNDLSKGVDCSGLTSQLYAFQGVKIPRTANEQYKNAKKVNVNNMQTGDLIFFNTLKNNVNLVDHVGIYIGDGKMLHASSGKKQVVTTDLNTKYWNSVLVGAGRY